jgi:hypothetical protein
MPFRDKSSQSRKIRPFAAALMLLIIGKARILEAFSAEPGNQDDDESRREDPRN